MIVTICGAYRNCGDHLIGARARALVERFVDSDIVTLDRKAISNENYAIMNSAKAVLLCGGPAYQRQIFPAIYPLDLDRIKPKVIPFGLGWKAPVGKDPATFAFDAPALGFIQRIHSNIAYSSVRDPLTLDVIQRQNITNVEMTGCPAWYDLEHFENTYKHNEKPQRIVLSMPAVMQRGVADLMLELTKRFPNSMRTLAFHHGVIPAWDLKGLAKAKDFLVFSALAMRHGWRIEGLTSSLPKMEALYGAADFHIGYRVHAHLMCLSQRKASILINEDARGEGQARALGQVALSVNKGNVEPILAEIQRHFDTRGAAIEQAVETMRQTFPRMKAFLQTI